MKYCSTKMQNKETCVSATPGRVLPLLYIRMEHKFTNTEDSCCSSYTRMTVFELFYEMIAI